MPNSVIKNFIKAHINGSPNIAQRDPSDCGQRSFKDGER